MCLSVLHDFLAQALDLLHAIALSLQPAMPVVGFLGFGSRFIDMVPLPRPSDA
jgi:hypothetical protein